MHIKVQSSPVEQLDRHAASDCSLIKIHGYIYGTRHISIEPASRQHVDGRERQVTLNYMARRVDTRVMQMH